MAEPPECKNFQPCRDTSDCIELSLTSGLFLKPIARLNITVTLPHLKSGQTISNFEVMEKLREAIKPDAFVNIKVSKSNLEFLRFDAEVDNRTKLNVIINKIDQKGIKLGSLNELLKIRATEAKLAFPSRHDWDSFFRDAKHMNEMKAGERPDTVHLQELPCQWFATSGTAKPSEHVLKKTFASFGDIRSVDIPTNDPYRKQMTAAISGISTFNFKQDFLFEAYVQFKEYIGFAKCMHALQSKKLVHNYGDKAWSANMKVDFDKTKHLSEYSIRKRATERERLMAADREKEEKLRRQKEMEELKQEAERMQAEEEERKKNAKLEEQRKEKDERRKQRETKRRLRRIIGKEGKGEDGVIDEEKLSKKIALEERKLLITQRKLESIRLFDVLFQRIKVDHRKELISLQEDGLKKKIREEPTKCEWFNEKCQQAYDLKIHFKKLYLAKRTPAREKQFRSSTKYFKKVCHNAKQNFVGTKSNVELKVDDSPGTKESKLRQRLITSLKVQQQEALAQQKKRVDRVVRGKMAGVKTESLSPISDSSSNFSSSESEGAVSSHSETSVISSEFTEDEGLEKAFIPSGRMHMDSMDGNRQEDRHFPNSNFQNEDQSHHLFNRGRGRHLYQRAYYQRGGMGFGRDLFDQRGRGRGFFKDGLWIDLSSPKADQMGGPPKFQDGHYEFNQRFRGNPFFPGRGFQRGRFMHRDNRRLGFRQKWFSKPFGKPLSRSRSRSRSSSHSRSRRRSVSSRSRSRSRSYWSRSRSKSRGHSKSRSRSRSAENKSYSKSQDKGRLRSESKSFSRSRSRSKSRPIARSPSRSRSRSHSQSKSRSGKRSKFRSRFSKSGSSSRSSSSETRVKSRSRRSRSVSKSKHSMQKGRSRVNRSRSHSADQRESKSIQKDFKPKDNELESEPDLSSESDYREYSFSKNYPPYERHNPRGGRGDFHGHRGFRFNRGRGRGDGYHNYSRGGYHHDRYNNDDHSGRWQRNNNWHHRGRGQGFNNYKQQYSPRGEIDVEEYHHMYKRYFKSLAEREGDRRRDSEEEREVNREERNHSKHSHERKKNRDDLSHHKRGDRRGSFSDKAEETKDTKYDKKGGAVYYKSDRNSHSNFKNREASGKRRSYSSSSSEYEKDDVLVAREKRYRQNIITRMSKKDGDSDSEAEAKESKTTKPKEISISSKVVVTKKKDYSNDPENKAKVLEEGRLYSDRQSEKNLKERLTNIQHQTRLRSEHGDRDDYRQGRNAFRGRGARDRGAIRGNRGGRFRSPIKRGMNRRDHNRDSVASEDSDIERTSSKSASKKYEIESRTKQEYYDMERYREEEERARLHSSKGVKKNRRHIRERVVETEEDDDDDDLQYGPKYNKAAASKRSQLPAKKSKVRRKPDSSFDSESDEAPVKRKRK